MNAASVEHLLGREIVVSGSTSNLGPGFDAVGLALDLDLRLRVVRATLDGRSHVEWRFAGEPPGGDNAIARGYEAGVEAFASHVPRPSLVVDVTTEIPMRAGLGSSAAALVAGLRLAECVAGRQPIDRLLSLACALEGHPDNTSASLLGGFIVAASLEDGSVVARAITWPEHWPLVVATPALTLETKVARAALPSSVLLRDAVFNVQRTALLVEAVHRRDSALLRTALDDRLHQRQRAPLVPGLSDALDWKDSGLIGVFLSGAGPSIAAIVDATVDGSIDRLAQRFGRLHHELGLRSTVRVLGARGVGE